ncbi:hypothetical protein HS088_TW03G00330 [Tripterygium wilfordii]|uniref:PsbQ-like protein 3 chloroplastic n=1 Tax=Tripterygium wilfordii TaxID=458696 RepID=A0A7J7DUN2_TRIWF|nr:psbQ-like protein 3, chloroplastic [Tripterygium wilfordii]XP_038697697.1 psbQ-like protein 3, chloroplastic [Tripterygium wilfordii]XP_038697698.1 psbQ-like protein 3, chloroplastic [Tripterygium wilfordii]KAF5750001.1 hypothetical protein HS088_TW03G00330 [Tripterygium wilfordii]
MAMRALVPTHPLPPPPHLCPPFSCHLKSSLQMPQKVLHHSISRRVVTIVAMATALLAKEAILSKKIANAFDFRLVAPDQTSEEAESVVRSHAEDLLSIKDLLEAESWKELQKALRISSSNLKRDIYTIIQAKPGSQRPQLRKLYYTLFDNVTKLDYAARDRDAAVVRQCYGNIVETLGNILSRI